MMSKLYLLRSLFAGLYFLSIDGLADSCPPAESITFKVNTHFFGLIKSYKPIAPFGWTIPDSTKFKVYFTTHFSLLYPTLVVSPKDTNGFVIIKSVSCSYKNLKSLDAESFELAKNINNNTGKTIQYFIDNGWKSLTTKPYDSQVKALALMCVRTPVEQCEW